MFRTLRSRLIASYVGIAVLCLVLALGVLLLLARDYAKRNGFKTLDEKKALVIPYVRLLIAGELQSANGTRTAPKRIMAAVKESIGGSGLRVLLIDPDTMEIEADTSNRYNSTGQRFIFDDSDTSSFYQELAKGEVRATATLPGGGGAYQYVAQRIRMDTQPGGLLNAIISGQDPPAPGKAGRMDLLPVAPYIVVLAQPVPQFATLLNDVKDYIVPAILVALAISFAAAYFLGRQISRPVARLASAAQAVARGDYSQQLPVEGSEELSTLTQQFNEMAAEVGRAHQVQRDFVANVSHDLKTPLTSIQGFSQAILDGAARTQADYHQAASIINTEAQRMNRMVTELLNLASLQNGLSRLEMKPVELAPIVSQLVLAMQPQAEIAGVELSAQFTRTNSLILADVDRLKQAFANLVENALKYTPPGGSVTITLEDVTEGVCVQVRDTGRGIPEHELRRVTERFYQVDKARSPGDGRSLGLGLAIAQEIVHAHGGTIAVESAEGSGTLVKVTLPAQTTKPGTMKHGSWPRTRSQPRRNGGGKLITSPLGNGDASGVEGVEEELPQIPRVSRN